MPFRNHICAITSIEIQVNYDEDAEIFSLFNN